MTTNRSSRCSVRIPCLVLLLLLLLQTTLVHGQKNSKGSSSPTQTQNGKNGKTKGATPSPTRTFKPSFTPSSSPSITLTSPPSPAPTVAPSNTPSSGPSVVTAQPAFSTNAPTFPSPTFASPTSLPPTGKPTSKPLVEQPANSSTSLTAIALPLLGITFEQDIQQSDLSASRLQQIISSWLSGYLVTNAEFGPALDHVDLQVMQMIQNPVRRRLQQIGGSGVIQVNVLFSGSAYFLKSVVKIPSPADLVKTLTVFFSQQSGVQALQDVLSSILTLDVTHGVQVYLNGGLVSSPTIATQPAALSSSSSTTQTTTSPANNNSLGLYFGLAVGVVALTLALFLVIWLRRRRSAKKSASTNSRFYLSRRREASKQLASAAAIQQARIGATPREAKVAVVATGLDDVSVQSAISFDSSMYTNNTEVPFRPSVPQSPGAYDVKRLERVIRSAKEIVKELSDDESSLYLRSI